MSTFVKDFVLSVNCGDKETVAETSIKVKMSDLTLPVIIENIKKQITRANIGPKEFVKLDINVFVIADNMSNLLTVISFTDKD
tara:strand:+ start:147 stop:395 length:249 start_codon:yes stop_codon:yes gene_type:complete